MGGSGSTNPQVNTAVGNIADLGKTAQQRSDQQYGLGQQSGDIATAGYKDLALNGSPFYRNMTDYTSGDIAQAFAPQRAQIYRNTSQYLNAPSGYRDALLTNLGAQQGRAFDSGLRQAYMAQQMAKMQGLAQCCP
jgi:hypothetical protein